MNLERESTESTDFHLLSRRENDTLNPRPQRRLVKDQAFTLGHVSKSIQEFGVFHESNHPKWHRPLGPGGNVAASQYLLPIVQMGPNFLVLKNAIDHPPAATAQISLSIDGHVDRWQVSLPEGIQAERRKTIISRCEANGSTAK